MQRLSVLLLVVTPFVTCAASPENFRDLVGFLVTIMNGAIGVLVVTATVIYFYGAARQLLKTSESDSAEMRKFLLMGIAIIFVMVSVWGILELLQNTLGWHSSGAVAP